jgi:drug/metabolite transporter (DMT)-like permease
MATAVTHMIGAIILTRVYQTSDSSRIAPLEYSYLAIVPVLDLVIWRVAPSGTTILGMILIALAGAFVAWREGTPPRPRPQTHEEVPG